MLADGSGFGGRIPGHSLGHSLVSRSLPVVVVAGDQSCIDTSVEYCALLIGADQPEDIWWTWRDGASKRKEFLGMRWLLVDVVVVVMV